MRGRNAINCRCLSIVVRCPTIGFYYSVKWMAKHWECVKMRENANDFLSNSVRFLLIKCNKWMLHMVLIVWTKQRARQSTSHSKWHYAYAENRTNVQWKNVCTTRKRVKNCWDKMSLYIVAVMCVCVYIIYIYDLSLNWKPNNPSFSCDFCLWHHGPSHCVLLFIAFKSQHFHLIQTNSIRHFGPSHHDIQLDDCNYTWMFGWLIEKKTKRWEIMQIERTYLTLKLTKKKNK